jgi:hypothetical protein
MAQPSTTQSPCNEAAILLAISAINNRQIPNVCRAAATYNVPESTLRDRLAGKASRRDCQPNMKKLTNPKEEAIIKHVLDLNLRGFLPSLNDVRYMANKLLAKRGAQPVGMR